MGIGHCINGNLPRCRDCVHFELIDHPTGIDKWDGRCDIGRNYHYVHSDQHACFSAEERPTTKQMSLFEEVQP